MSESGQKMLKGSCNCGHIRYEVRQPFTFQAACHCIQCQKHTQSAFSLVGRITRDAFRLVSGELKKWTKTADSGTRHDCYFCPECGNRIYHQDPLTPDVIRLKLGTLDDTSVIEPQIHVWTQHKQAWYDLPGDVPNHPTQPDLTKFPNTSP
jgi:hypothetical protein